MGKAVIITAPSGAGKSTIADHLLSVLDALSFSVSATTREPRPGEVDGKDYHYISEAVFRQLIDQSAFVEWEEVYNGILYGTLRSEVDRLWAAGRSVLFVVDVVGARDLKEFFGNRALSVFIAPPSMEELERRLRNRGTESEEELQRRLARVGEEMLQMNAFDLVVTNDDLDRAKAEAAKKVGNFLNLADA